MSVVALVCARGGSKGLPGKNTRLLGGRPLIGWAIAHAKGVRRVTRVIVSTDSEEIANVARSEGAEVPFLRPPQLARDDSPEWLVWRHALTFLARGAGTLPSALLVVPATSPLRSIADLERCLDEFEQHAPDMVITVTDAHRNPYFNMVTVDEGGYSRLVIPPSGAVVRRQDAPPVYDVTTVAYVARPSFVLSQDGTFQGRVRQVHIPAERALDIDTPLDFRIAECLLSSR